MGWPFIRKSMAQHEFPHIEAELAKFDTEQGSWLESLKKQNPSLRGKIDSETMDFLNDILAEIAAGNTDSGTLPEFADVDPNSCTFQEIPGLPAIAGIINPEGDLIGFTRMDGDPTLVS